MKCRTGIAAAPNRRSFADRIKRTSDDIAFEIDSLYTDLRLAMQDMSPMEKASSIAALGLLLSTIIPWVSFWEGEVPEMDQCVHFPVAVAVFTLYFALKRSNGFGRQKRLGIQLLNRRKALVMLLLGNLSMTFSLGFIIHCLRVGGNITHGVDMLFGYYCTVFLGISIAFTGFFEFYKGAEFEAAEPASDRVDEAQRMPLSS